MIGEKSTINEIITLTTCCVCGKHSIENQKYECQFKRGVYCNQCIKNNNCEKCPMMPTEPTNQLRSLVCSVQIRCSNSSKGCGELCTISNFNQHEVFCPYSSTSFSTKFSKESPFKSLHKNAEPFIPKTSTPSQTYSGAPGYEPLHENPDPVQLSKLLTRAYDSYEKNRGP